MNRFVNVLKAIVRSAVLTPVRRCHKWLRRARRRAGEAGIVRQIGLDVQRGPFTGMLLVPSNCPLGPKVLGTHELELWPVIEAIIRSDVQHVVNIGAAEGYYAVGLLRCLPDARVSAFELESSHHEFIKALALRNGVDARLTVYGICRTEELISVLKPDEATVLVVDVEGAERELLDLEGVPALRTARILVEVHDFVDPQISTLLRRRFQNTHRLTVYRSRPRQPADLPSVSGISTRLLLSLAQEGRPTTMEWFWFEPGVQMLST